MKVLNNPTEEAAPATAKKGLRLSDLKPGDSARVIRLALPDTGCRKRFAELGLAEGMRVSVVGTGTTLMLAVGTARMALACRCADDILVMKV